MLSITLHIEDSASQVVVSLSPNRALLVGRDPQVSKLDSALRDELRGLTVEPVTVPSLRVSGNHLLLRAQEDQVQALDLNSRNGTWLRLSPQHPVTVTGQLDLTLDLARTPPGTVLGTTPEMADWATEKEYPGAIVQAVTNWMAKSGVHAQVFASNQERSPHSPIPLADGSYLHILPPSAATFDVPWGALIDRVREFVNTENARFEQLQGHDEDFILVSPLMREVHRQIVDAAAYGLRLMILGPTGAGKERLARCFHKHSRQHRGPYATVNCALLKENLLYAQLFGAKRGSYTGAVQDVVGVIEAANEGTLFLDEVGEMDLEVQKALLRFLDSRGEYRRLGDTATRRANVQIVCATNAALDSAGERRGKFRDDLWYRLAVKVVLVPPLRQRREDILAFLKNRMLRGGQIRASDALTPGALQLVLQDPWPGNFRDLENFVERLPPLAQPRSLDEAICAGALAEGRGMARHAVNSGAFRTVSAAPSVPESHWADVCTRANQAFEEDHGGPPTNWGQIQLYNDKYLKPVFIATACGLSELNELSKNVNYSELARRLNIADGTTVKMHLSRYIERFRKPAAAEA